MTEEASRLGRSKLVSKKKEINAYTKSTISEKIFKKFEEKVLEKRINFFVIYFVFDFSQNAVFVCKEISH